MAEKDQKPIELQILVRPMVELSEECGSSTSEDHNNGEFHQHHREEEEEEDGVHHEDKGFNKVDEEREIIEKIHHVRPLTRLVLGEFKDEDDDGFRTPTSPDKRIPLIPKQCPPAPRKDKLYPSIMKMTMKRKKSLKKIRGELLKINASEKIEL